MIFKIVFFLFPLLYDIFLPLSFCLLCAQTIEIKNHDVSTYVILRGVKIFCVRGFGLQRTAKFNRDILF